MIRRLLMVALVALWCAGTQAQNAAPCSDPAFRQLDFWVGDWDLSWTNADGSEGLEMVSSDVL